MRKILTMAAMAALLSSAPAIAKWPGSSGPGNGQTGQNGQPGNNGNNGNNGKGHMNKNMCMGWHEDHDKAMKWYYKHYGDDYRDYLDWYMDCYEDKYDD